MSDPSDALNVRPRAETISLVSIQLHSRWGEVVPGSV
eukprot:gene32175-38919_t